MHQYPFIADIPADEYHAAARRGDFLSSHLLGDFRSCPLLYHKKMTGAIEPVDSAAYQVGRAIHTLILEGRSKFDEEYLVSEGPINPKTGEPFGKLTKAYKEWSAAQSKTVVSSEDFGWMTKLQAMVWIHPVAGKLLDKGRAEGTVRTTYRGEPCQIRMDWFNPEGEFGPTIVDLKTCDSIDHFERDAIRYGYPGQLAFYRSVFREASGGVTPQVRIIAVEKREPYRVGVWHLTGELLDQAEARNEMAISLLKECRCRDSWPTGYEQMRTLDVQS